MQDSIPSTYKKFNGEISENWGRLIKNIPVKDRILANNQENCFITLKYHNLIKSDPEIVNKLMNIMESNIDIEPFAQSISTNLFRGNIIFGLFDNLESIDMICHPRYKFSITYMSSMISKSSSLQTLTMSGDRHSCELIWSHQDELVILSDAAA